MTIDTPRVDWFALSPTLALIGAAGALLLVAVFVPSASASVWRSLCGRASTVAFVLAIVLADRSPDAARPSSRTRSSATAGPRVAQILIAGCGLVAVASPTASAGARSTWPSTTRSWRRRAAAWRSSSRPSNLMTMFLGLEWFSIALYIMCAIDIDLAGSLEAGLKYLIVGSVGAATLLFGSRVRLRLDRRAGVRQIARRLELDHDALLVAGLALIIVGPRIQSLGRAVPHVDARRLPGRTHAGDRRSWRRRRRSPRSSLTYAC